MRHEYIDQKSADFKIYIKENVIVFIASNFLLFYKIDWKDKYICKYMW